jgi:hypothetical protein
LRYLGVVVDDIKTSYGVIEELKRRSIPFLLLKAGEAVPAHISAVIVCGTSRSGFERRAVLYDGDAKSTVLRALSLAAGRETFRLVVVGIDPGESTGIAIIGDGELLEAYAVRSLSLEEELGKILDTFSAARFLFRIGKGCVSEQAFRRLKEDPRCRVVFVPETKMTLPPIFSKKGLKRDARSALIIALTAESGGLADQRQRK